MTTLHAASPQDNPMGKWLLEAPMFPKPAKHQQKQSRIICLFEWQLRRYLAGITPTLDRTVYLGNQLILLEPRCGKGLLGLRLREIQDQIEVNEFYEIMGQYEKAMAEIEQRLGLFFLLDLCRLA